MKTFSLTGIRIGRIAAPLLCGAVSSSAADRPNVLFIVADDMNDFVGTLRSYVPNLTPNMDRLANRGVNFSNAHANGLYCAPSRVSFLTGIHPVTSGYYGEANNAAGHLRNNPVLKNTVTMPESFTNNGYAAFITGKIYNIEPQSEYQHFQGDTGNGDGRGISHDFGPWPWDGRTGKGYIPPSAHPSLPPPFDKLAYSGYARLSDIPDIPADPANGIPGFRGWSLNRKPWRYVNDDDRDLLPDEQSVKWAVQIFQRKRERPFFMAFGFNRPHTPLYVPDKYFDMFPLDKIVLPPMPKDDLSDIPEEGRRLNDGTARLYRQFYESSGEQGIKEFMQAYLASIRFVDDQLGILLDALEKSPAGKNTVIVFTSDQGYHLGEKDRIGKNTCWERSTHVPLIIAGAGVSAKGAQVKRPVTLVDVYPTLLELCNLPLHPNQGRQAPELDGHSLVPFLSPDPSRVWAGPSVAVSATDHARTVRSELYRYILHDGGGEELYDVQKDPDELRNLAANPEYDKTKAELRNLLETIGERKHAE